MDQLLLSSCDQLSVAISVSVSSLSTGLNLSPSTNDIIQFYRSYSAELFILSVLLVILFIYLFLFLQVVEDGYEFFAKRQLVTLFSAPNYCGEFDNAGAMMSVDETLMCSFQVSGFFFCINHQSQMTFFFLSLSLWTSAVEACSYKQHKKRDS